MSYAEIFIAAVPDGNKDDFIRHCKEIAPVFTENGAIKYIENWGVDVPDGEITSLPMAVKKQDGETVVFSLIIWPDKATRDAGMEKVMEDPRCDFEKNPMPFDAKRVIFGGFEPVLGEF